MQHTRCMPKKASPHPKPKRRPTFIRQWRKHRDLTLVEMSERLHVELEFEIDHGQISRIERAVSPYGQDVLEAFAAVLRCDPVDLLIRDPSDPEGLWSIYGALTPPERHQAVEILKTIHRTGTDG